MNRSPSLQTLPRRWTRIAALLPVALLIGRAALAQEPDPAQAPGDADPPDRVARLSYVQGDVSTPGASDGERERAELNRPLTSGDEIDVGERARAELQVDVATVQVGERSSVSLETLDDQNLALRLIDGEIVVRVREIREGDHIDIETANARVSLMEPGLYRLQVEHGGDATIVAVRDGGAQIESGPQVFSLRPAQEGRYTGTTSLEEEVHAIGSRDELEAWADKREMRDTQESPSSRYVSRDVIGYEDLDEYGQWDTDPSYGPVWYPQRISYGWAPYRFGQWAYVGPWGWTWIDQAPWGFAPFHYGRWAYLRSRWCWVPGPRHIRPVYAPALVGWVPRGSGYAWFPLGPREVYVPRHHASDRYVRQVNVSNTTIVNVNHITNVYRNREPRGHYMNERVADDVKAIPRQTFTETRPAVRPTQRPAGSRPVAVRPTYQTPVMRPSGDRDGPRGEAPRTGVPRGNIPSGAIPGRTIPKYTPPDRSTPPARVRPTPAPSPRSSPLPVDRTSPRTVAPPPVRSEPAPRSTPPPRVIERPSRPVSSSPPERRYIPPPARPSDPDRNDRKQSGRRNLR